MTEPFASDAENRDTGEAGSGEPRAPCPSLPAPPALPARPPELQVCEASQPWHQGPVLR